MTPKSMFIRPWYLIDCKLRWAQVLFCVFLIMAGFFSRLNAQGVEPIFSQISIEEGLSQSIVQCIAQDSRGYMWFGTEDGLNKYDGYRIAVIRRDPDDPNSLSYNEILSIIEDQDGMLWIGTFYGGLDRFDPVTKHFKHYRFAQDDSTSLSNNVVRCIYEDRSGALWIGTEGGLNKFDKETERFTRYMNDPSDPNSLSSNSVQSICEDQAGIIWVGTQGGGLNRFDRETDKFTRYRNDPNDPNSLSHNSVRSVYEDRSGTLWVGTIGGGLNNLDRETDKFTRYRNDPNDPNSLSNDQIYAIYEDKSGVLWIGTNGGGLNRFDRKNEKFIRYVNDPGDITSIGYDEIRAIYEDRSGVIWIGTYGGGVNKFDRKRKQFVRYNHDSNNPNSLGQEIVWTIYEDEAGILWIGTHGGGLDKFDRQNNRFTHYRNDPNDPSSLSGDIVRVICEDHDGVFWIGTHGGGVDRFDRRIGKFTCFRNDPKDPHSLSHDEIRSIYEDRNGILWIGTNGAGLNKFNRTKQNFTIYRNSLDDPNSLSNDFVRVIYEDSDGLFWIGTQGGGLDRFDREKGTFTHYRYDSSNPKSLSNDYVFSIHEDKSGVIWLGTWGGGLNRFDKESGTFTHYTTKDGLASDAVYGMLEDAYGNLWISSNNGISRFNPKKETFKNYSVEDGLQSNEFNGGSFFKSKSGEMFFGGIHGFNSFYPENIRDNPFVPQIVITSFLKLNKEVELDQPIWATKKLILSHKDFIFSFEFAALDYTAPNKNMYAYKMEGLHKDWIYTDSEKRYATFTTLPSGNYRFVVKGSNNDGVWNESGTAIEITITPPFWSTAWFRILLILAFLGLAIGFYRWRLKSVRMKTELESAHDAQMSIMPQSDPQVEGFDISGVCIPANDVGGDFYDIFWQNTQKTKLGVAIGDVAGKAMKAAMIAVMSSGMVYSRADEKSSPKDVITYLNRSMYSKTDDMMFTALCFASIDVTTRKFACTLAGMNKPILKSGDFVGNIEGLEPGFPLGAFSDSTYSEDMIQLKSGDLLVFFTDGIVEAQNKANEFYDSESLIHLLARTPTSNLSAKEVKSAIIEDVRRFAGNALQQDDMTLVVVKSI